jgi:hypothetical protein
MSLQKNKYPIQKTLGEEKMSGLVINQIEEIL